MAVMASAAGAGAAAAGTGVVTVSVRGAGVLNTGSSVFAVTASIKVVRSPGPGRVSVVGSAGGASPSTGGGLMGIVPIRYFVVRSSRLAGRIAPAATVAANTSTRSIATGVGPF